ncbi:MAG: AAA family ATPase [Clostridia bacterium]|nr:AAA family ATPase [Clostridia bacterium]
MTIKEFGDCVEYNIEHNIKHAILGLGAPGVGKSQIIRQIGKKYGYKVIDIRLAQMSEVEIGGLIYPNESRTKTVWLSPEILPDEERDGKNTILLLDEITSCTKRVQVAAYQLILDRRVGQYQLPEGTFVVALGNREDDDGVYIQLAGPLADRFEIHYIEPNFEDWKNDFALKNGVHPFVVNYLTFKPSALHNQKAEGGSMVFATPRSWVRVSDILNFDPDVTKPVIRHKIIGNVGEVEGNQFVEYCKQFRNVVTADDFLSGKSGAPRSPEEISILVSSLINKASFLGTVSWSMITDEQKRQVEKIIRALFRIPQAEYTVVGLKGLLAINREAVKSVFLQMDDTEIMQFITKHRYALGLEEETGVGSSKKWLAMWE